MTKEERIGRAEQAARLLDEPLIWQVIEDAQKSEVQAWLDGPPDQERALVAWSIARAYDRIRSILRASVDDGRLAAIERDHELRLP